MTHAEYRSKTISTMPSGAAHLAKVFKSIKENTRSVAGQTDKVERLFDCIRKFYVSLFAANQGKAVFFLGNLCYDTFFPARPPFGSCKSLNLWIFSSVHVSFADSSFISLKLWI